MGVVEAALLVVVQNLVGSLCSLEADLGFGAVIFGSLVRVVRERGLQENVGMRGGVKRGAADLVISFLDLDFGCAAGNSQDLCV